MTHAPTIMGSTPMWEECCIFMIYYSSRKSNCILLELRITITPSQKKIIIITITLQWQPIYRHPLWLWL